MDELDQMDDDTLEEFIRTRNVAGHLPDIWKRVQHSKGALRIALTCLESHFESCDLLRLTFYNLVKAQGPLNLRLPVLRSLTREGRLIRHFERDICALIHNWLSLPQDTLCLIDILGFLSNLVKFSFVELLESDFENVFEDVCVLCCSTTESPLVLSCLSVFDTAVKYASFSSSLDSLVKALSYSYSLPGAQSQTCEIAKNLFSSHRAILVVEAISQLLAKSMAIGMAEGAIQLFIRACWIDIWVSDSVLRPAYLISLLLELQDAPDEVLLAMLKGVCLLCKRATQYLNTFDRECLVNLLYSLSPRVLEEPLDLASVERYPEMDQRSLSQLYSTALLSVLELQISDLSLASRIKVLRILAKPRVLMSSDLTLWTLEQSLGIISLEFPGIDFLFVDLMDKLYVDSHSTEVRLKAFDVFIKFSNSAIQLPSIEMINAFTDRVLAHLSLESDAAVFQLALDWLSQEIIEAQDLESAKTGMNVLLQCCSIETSNWKPSQAPYSNLGWKANLVVPTMMTMFAKAALTRKWEVMHILFEWLARLLACSEQVSGNVRLKLLTFFSSFEYRGSSLSFYLEQSIHLAHPKAIVQFERYQESIGLMLMGEPHYEVLKAAFSALHSHLENPIFIQKSKWPLSNFRRLLCDVIHGEKAGISLVDVPLTMRKSDLYSDLAHCVVGLLPYKEVFSRMELDDILSALLLGLSRWPGVARSFLHGLTICLLEIPKTLIRQTNSILVRISQTTSTSLAVPNLEFLSALARSPELHVNFTEPDYKRIFGIVLQYVRSASSKMSLVDQYVIHLAYHVLSLWFMSLKLLERKRYVGFIIHCLTSGVESKESGTAELTELVLDMMALHTFVDCWPKPKDRALLKHSRKISKTWMRGLTLISVAVDGFSGWIQVILRRPTGVTTFHVFLENSVQKSNDMSESEWSDLLLPIKATLGLDLTPIHIHPSRTFVSI